MTITLNIPGELTGELGAKGPMELSRHLLEALVLEAYRVDRVGAPRAAEILGLSRFEWNALLKERQVMKDAYSVEDLERDVAAIQHLRSEGVLPAA